MADEPLLTLIPNLTNDPNPRHARENDRRIEQFIRKLVAQIQDNQSSNIRRFMASTE